MKTIKAKDVKIIVRESVLEEDEFFIQKPYKDIDEFKFKADIINICGFYEDLFDINILEKLLIVIVNYHRKD